MNSQMSKKMCIVATVFLITASFIPALAGPVAAEEGRPEKGFHKKHHRRPALGIWRDPQIVQELELTTAQVKQIRDADFTLREKRLALKAQRDSLRLQMDKAFSGDTVDDAAVLALAEKISEVKGKMFVQKIEARLALGKILNAEQIQKLKQNDMQRKKRGSYRGGKHLSWRHSAERALPSTSNDTKN